MTDETAPNDERPFRYDARAADQFESKWQSYWSDHNTWEVANPSGPLSDGWNDVAGRPKRFILDMFPYPSGTGLHVGHPLGYIGTDVYGRFLRMRGFNVLHTIGYDAFGLPAEQYAVETGQHPRVTTENNVNTMRKQLQRLGLAHDQRRAVSTTDPAFVRFTQWIFLQIYNAYCDDDGVARPIAVKIAELEQQPAWFDKSPKEQSETVDAYRLVYRTEAMVNWCPGLGTVLANEEVTADGRSDRGNFPVYKRPLTQWMMRITAFADRLLNDLDGLDWPEPVKLMQRNWIGRSTGAHVDFHTRAGALRVFTTRPDTLFGATFMVLSPEHPLVDALTTDERRSEVEAYRDAAERITEQERTADSREKTGVFLGSYATNPVSNAEIPIYIADYVLAGYGTGAIMAVPAEDERDWAFAEKFGLPVIRTVAPPPDHPDDEPFTGEGVAINSDFINGMGMAEAKETMIRWLEERGVGQGAVTTKLRDWLFSRQRYWGEPFPIVYDTDGRAIALPESMLPVELPELEDFAPRSRPDDPDADPEPPLRRVEWWVNVELDLGEGKRPYLRETNTMPQWAGSCWYYLRYLDPTNENDFVDPATEKYWMQSSGTAGGVDLYVGGVEHAVLHLLYARFWHKVLFDLGHVSTPEPFQRLFNQGMIQAAAFTDERGMYVNAHDVVEEPDGTFTLNGLQKVNREFGKMGKSLKNSVTPDEIYAQYGADTLRVYEMAMGPLDVSRPWRSDDIVGAHRLLQRAWRAMVDEASGAVVVSDDPIAAESRRILHRTIAAVTEDYDNLRFNTAVARVTELVNHVTKAGVCARETAETLALLLAPLAPHIAEEMWQRLGKQPSIGFASFPVADPAQLIDDTVTLVVQVNGKVRERVDVAAGADAATLEATALGLPRIVELLNGTAPRKVIVRPPALVNVVV
ncbi:MAG TPA: leucine--tRNA ligase [Acidimicrobiales bacterium]|nr:leucine--tRNA ligase [Acidimicrobiales bacterium]